jgi:organic hydroperoxide reductase OsmC/OhrA
VAQTGWREGSTLVAFEYERAKEEGMSVIKSMRFPVSIEWQGGRLTKASAPSKADLEIATPPEFPGGIEDVWSPEELLVAATASCYAVTLIAIAERAEIPLYTLRVSGTGHLSKRDDGRFGFVAIELDAEIETNAVSVRAAESAAERAEKVCLVSQALDIPVHLGAVVRPAAEPALT